MNSVIFLLFIFVLTLFNLSNAVTGSETVTLRIKMPDGIVKRVVAQPNESMNDIKEKIGVSKKKRFSLDEDRTKLSEGKDTVASLRLANGNWLYLKPQEIEGAAEDLEARLESRKPDTNRASKTIPSASSMDEFNKYIKLARGRLLVVDFYADWCGPCKQVAPEFEKMFKEMPSVNFLKVNVDVNKEATKKYNVKSMPTFLFLKNGQEVHRELGANAAGLRSAIQARSR